MSVSGKILQLREKIRARVGRVKEHCLVAGDRRQDKRVPAQATVSPPRAAWLLPAPPGPQNPHLKEGA